MRRVVTTFLLMIIGLTATAGNITIHAINRPAAAVFRSIIQQTGMNFIYSSELLKDVRVSVEATDRPLRSVLTDMFRDTDIEFRISGNNVVLKRRSKPKPEKKSTDKVTPDKALVQTPSIAPRMLDEVIVTSRQEPSAIETAEIGAQKVTAEYVRNTPTLFGENDVIKALHTLPGISEGTEGLAGMHVHGGNSDENLYMLDNVPLYQINHFAGLFSAFNTDIIGKLDFYKSSVPAKYDGRLSSFLDVRLKDSEKDVHHGSGRLGLTSGSFNISGPIGERTTYLAAIRRSWFDLLSTPMIAYFNSQSESEKIKFHYYFTDLNARFTHRFSPRLKAFINAYYGDDALRSGWEEKDEINGATAENERINMNWGNLMVEGGANYRFSPNVSAEFTAAYTQYFARMRHVNQSRIYDTDSYVTAHSMLKTDNNIHDMIFRGDFNWRAGDRSLVRFGAAYTHHSFLPAHTVKQYSVSDAIISTSDRAAAYYGNEAAAYIEDDWRVSESFRVNGGVHLSLFDIDRRVRYGISPRFSLSWHPAEQWSLKGAYSRTTQYVHQLAQSYLSLPTDQWIPVAEPFKPQIADKVSAGAYWQSDNGVYAISVEAYYKSMHNLLEYRDEYYLYPPLEVWNDRLTSGQGTAKGFDLNIEKKIGCLTGHLAYSLAWADRTFAEKNGGQTYPARFDNRHTINAVINWKVSNRVQLNASWTGHSGNHVTLLPQVWQSPSLPDNNYIFGSDIAPLRAPVNNFQLPFYHRLDLSCTVNNSRGYWTFSLYNAYCHLNTIGVRTGYKDYYVMTPEGYFSGSRPVFQQIKLLPIIPSVSYTWIF